MSSSCDNQHGLLGIQYHTVIQYKTRTRLPCIVPTTGFQNTCVYFRCKDAMSLFCNSQLCLTTIYTNRNMRLALVSSGCHCRVFSIAGLLVVVQCKPGRSSLHTSQFLYVRAPDWCACPKPGTCSPVVVVVLLVIYCYMFTILHQIMSIVMFYVQFHILYFGAFYSFRCGMDSSSLLIAIMGPVDV